MIRNEMLNSFAQLETIKNSVISGIPDSILNKKISDIRQQYFPEDILAENLKKENTVKKPNENAENFLDKIAIQIEKSNEDTKVINDDDENENINNKDLSFSKVNKGSHLTNCGNAFNEIKEIESNNKEKEQIIADSAKNESAPQNYKTNITKRSNLKNKQSSKKSLSDGEMEIEKSENKLNLRENNNISNKKNLNNLSSLKNKAINNLTKAPDNLTAINYFSDNNLNKDYKRISKHVIEATPNFVRNAKAEKNEIAKENNNSRNHQVINNNIAKRYHSPSPAVSKNKKVAKVNKDLYKTPNKEK